VSLLLFGCCHDDCGRVFIVFSCLLVIFHFTAWLDLDRNRLKGNIPNQIGFLTILGESSIVWWFVVTIFVMFFISLSCSSSFFILQLLWISGVIV
jgi:hypothetical protein